MIGVKTYQYIVLNDTAGWQFVEKLRNEIEGDGAQVRVTEKEKILEIEFSTAFEANEEIQKLSKKDLTNTYYYGII